MKPPKDLRSKFILKQEARKQKAEDDATEKRRIDAEKEREVESLQFNMSLKLEY